MPSNTALAFDFYSPSLAARTGKIRQSEQMGFVDAALADCGGRRSAALLARLDAATPWETLAAPIRTLPEYCNRGAGQPPWCPGPMEGR